MGVLGINYAWEVRWGNLHVGEIQVVQYNWYVFSSYMSMNFVGTNKIILDSRNEHFLNWNKIFLNGFQDQIVDGRKKAYLIGLQTRGKPNCSQAVHGWPVTAVRVIRYTRWILDNLHENENLCQAIPDG